MILSRVEDRSRELDNSSGGFLVTVNIVSVRNTPAIVLPGNFWPEGKVLGREQRSLGKTIDFFRF
jgi:hypothetical protein